DQRYPGWFINAKGDTIRGFIFYSNKLDIQKTSEYSNDAKGEKVKFPLDPELIRELHFADVNFKSFEYGVADPSPFHFLLQSQKGELNLYQFFTLLPAYVPDVKGQHPATGYDEEYLQVEFLIVNSNQKQFIIAGEGALVKNADELFSANNVLLKKISDKEKEYRYNNLPAI